MFDIITAVSTNSFRTFIIKKFLSVFFPKEIEDKRKESYLYLLFFIVTTAVYLIFHFPPANIIVNLIMIYMIAQIYEGEQKKKILVSILIYGINMACDILAIYSFSNYVVGEDYNEIAAYVTVLLISLCEFITERFLIKKKEMIFTPPYWNILMLIPVISIAILFVLLMNNLNKRIILVLVSAGILFINMLIFYLYNVLLDAYIKLEENALFERQIASYSNQLDLLMQSEEKISSLRHDMKHHLNELMILAGKDSKQEVMDYIQNMRMFMENKSEYSSSGNKEVDSILNYMIRRAQEVLDKVEYKINIPKEIGVRLFDLNVIFGNLLDNAIAAANNSKDKWLSVLVRYDKGMLFINIRNSYEGNVVRQGKEYLTTKKEIGRHGLGLQNVKRVVKSYQGNMEILDNDNIFDVKIMLYTLMIK
ncbi:MAG: GHKL domain-containing protein [Lachnospiraceae bacterium]|nr:GHKL domain-containing protein [Lachnospiraceae bacterium]